MSESNSISRKKAQLVKDHRAITQMQHDMAIAPVMLPQQKQSIYTNMYHV